MAGRRARPPHSSITSQTRTCPSGQSPSRKRGYGRPGFRGPACGKAYGFKGHHDGTGQTVATKRNQKKTGKNTTTTNGTKKNPHYLKRYYVIEILSIHPSFPQRFCSDRETRENILSAHTQLKIHWSGREKNPHTFTIKEIRGARDHGGGTRKAWGRICRAVFVCGTNTRNASIAGRRQPLEGRCLPSCC